MHLAFRIPNAANSLTAMVLTHGDNEPCPTCAAALENPGKHEDLVRQFSTLEIDPAHQKLSNDMKARQVVYSLHLQEHNDIIGVMLHAGRFLDDTTGVYFTEVLGITTEVLAVENLRTRLEAFLALPIPEMDQA